MNQMHEYVLENIDEYKSEINGLIDWLAETKRSAESEDDFLLKIPAVVHRLERLNVDLATAFDFNKVKLTRYPLSIRINGELDDIRVPAARVSSYIASLQRGMKAINSTITMDLVDVLRGSTILCFDYGHSKLTKKTIVGRREANETLKAVVGILASSEKPQEAIREVVPKQKKAKTLLNSLRTLAPVIGSGSMVVEIHAPFSDVSSLELNTGIREKINEIQPTRAPKDVRVDWENNVATGFIREISDVSRSFMLYADDTDDEEKALIKIHYTAESQEEFAVSEWKKKVSVEFKKIGANKYELVKISRGR